MKTRSFYRTMASGACAGFLLMFLFAVNASAQTSRITVTKDFCASIGPQNTCNGIPASFPSSVTFLVDIGTYDVNTGVFTVSGTSANVVVGIGNNANGATTTGDIFTTGTWVRVCEVVPSSWNSIPRPESSTNGQQYAQGRCLIAQLGPGNNSLKFINGPGGTTAAEATISGRVVDANGVGISRVQLTLVDGETGEAKTAVTNSFGYYSIAGVEVERLYVLNALHRRHRFAESQKTILPGDNALNIDFVAMPTKQ